MAKKAKLDILEIAPEEPVEETGQGTVSVEKEVEEVSPREQAGAGFPLWVIGWVRKPLFWIILAAVVLLGLTTGVLVGIYQGKEDPVVTDQKGATPSGSPSPEVKQDALFQGMVVDQKDEKGNIRILFCDIALELEEQKAAGAIDGDRVDVRDLIYSILKKEPAKEGLSAEGRGRLKEKLKNELNSRFGENLVKAVYFTRYELD